jgi:DNA-binding transcriptional ArsR family regulator
LKVLDWAYSHELAYQMPDMNSNDLRNTEKVLKAIANQRRITIVQLLRKHEVLSVGDLAKELKLSFRSTSRHLAVLRSAEVVLREQEGLVMNYRLAQPMNAFVRLLVK